MPRLNCTYNEFIAILLAHGFEHVFPDKGSHKKYRGIVGRDVKIVTVAGHNLNDHPLPATLQSMIRQSGLPKALFRK